MAIQLLHGVNYTPSCIYVRTRRTLISQSGRTDLFRLSRIANNKQECAGRLKTTLVFANDLIVPFDTVAQNVRGITQSTDAGLGDHHISLPTPIKIEKLTECLVGYHQDEKHALLQGLTQGFRLCYSGPDRTRVSANHKSARDDIATLKMKIQKELDAGRVAGPFDKPPLPNFQVSPLGLVPKKVPGEFRVIHDLSYPKGDSINSTVSKEYATIHYQPFDDLISVIKLLGSGTLVAKTDIESAFRLIPIHPHDYNLLGFVVDGKFYYDRCLPMGSSVSCRTFELFSNALHWILENKCQVAYVWHLLDDFVVCGPPDSPACTESLKCVLDLAESLGVPINHSKTVAPTPCLTVVGIEVDTDSMQLRLPEDKLLHARDLCKQFRVKRKVTLRQLQSLIGFLNFACNVVVPGRAFLRRLIDLTKGVSSKHFHIRLTRESRRDIDAWLVFLQNFNGVSMLLSDVWLSSDKVRLYTDSAMSAGYAAVYGRRWFNGSWPEGWQGYHITVLELYPIVAAVCVWGHLLANHCVLFMCDNMSVVEIINKQSSKDQHVMSLMRRFVIETMKYNILFKCKHVPGKSNIVADHLSRFQVAQARESQPQLNATPVQLPEYILPWTLQ